ncbi:MAG TPA: hypothetical protein VK539_26720 [Myxococcaceae bacterium]|nr:hypothetical protein [Myxococcaceae bacterium]
MPVHTLSRGVVLWMLAAAASLQLACIEPIVLGGIPPSAFQFTNIVPHRESGAGGWKVAQVIIMLGRLSPHYPEATACEIEVGVPEQAEDTKVPDTKAQRAAARASDAAAREVLKERLPTAMACRQFRAAMELYLKHPKKGGIPGARVSAFQQAGVPRRTFPEDL